MLSWLSSKPKSSPRNKKRTISLNLESLEDRATPAFAGSLISAADSGAPPEVRVFDAETGQLRSQFLAYDANFLGGVRVASGDVDGDFIDDLVTTPGAGAPPHVRVFSGATGAEIGSFFGFPTGMVSGTFVSIGDIDADGLGEIILGTGAGSNGFVNVFRFNGAPVLSFSPYGAGYFGGVRVAAADTNGDGFDEIVTSTGFGSVPHVQAFGLQANGSLLTYASFFAYASTISSGVYVAGGDIDGDGFDEIITGTGPGSAPHVKAFDAFGQAIQSFFAFAPSYGGGVRVDVADVNRDGYSDIIAGTGYGAQGIMTAFDGLTTTPIQSVFALPSGFNVGVFVAGSETPMNLVSTPSAFINQAYLALQQRVIADQTVYQLNNFNYNGFSPFDYGAYGYGYGGYYNGYFLDSPGLYYGLRSFFSASFYTTYADASFFDDGFYDSSLSYNVGDAYGSYYTDPSYLYSTPQDYNFDPSQFYELEGDYYSNFDSGGYDSGYYDSGYYDSGYYDYGSDWGYGDY
jgi:hypothetical protein